MKEEQLQKNWKGKSLQKGWEAGNFQKQKNLQKEEFHNFLKPNEHKKMDVKNYVLVG
jgi:hypothetical protein